MAWISSQVSSISMAFAVQEVASSGPVSIMLSWKLSMLGIPLDKELTANCHVEIWAD